MASQRPGSRGETPRGGSGGSVRPGTRTSRSEGGRTERGSSRARPGDSRASAASATATGGSGRAPSPRRPRFTGRAAVLVLVLAVLTVSYASSMRAYLDQRSHIGELKAAIDEREASIHSLEREKQRWEDPAFVRAQARARFGYLMPGETGFLVLDESGKPLESQASLSDPQEVIKTVPTAWWSKAWDSVELAGNPPAPAQAPATEIDGVKKQ